MQSMAIGDDMPAPEEEDGPGNVWDQIVAHNLFDNIATFLILTNMMVIAIEVNMRCHGTEAQNAVTFLVINITYGVLYLVELILRILPKGVYASYFSDRVEMRWFWFDSCMLIMQYVEILLTLLVISSKDLENLLSFGRMMRVVRVVRVIRIIRVMRFFRSFRILLMMILGTMKSGVWATCLLVLIMVIFGIIFAQAVVDTLAAGYANEENAFTLEKYYGTVPRAVFTLFKAIIGGVDWDLVVDPLSDCGEIYVALFLIYIIFVQLVVMNVVTGLFLQSAIERAQQDQEHGIQLRLQEKNTFIQKLEELFKQLDSTNNGTISLQEFETHLQSEHMKALFQTFEIENADAWTFFKLLDADGGGSVDIEEFVHGCIRLKGPAKSIQIAQLMYHHKWIMNQLVELQQNVNHYLKPLSRQCGALLHNLDVPQQPS